MEFHETVRGKVFFEHQLPELIKALNRLVDAVETTAEKTVLEKAGKTPNARVQLPYEVCKALRNVLDSKTQSEKFANLLLRDILSDAELTRKFAVSIGKAVIDGCEREEYNCDSCCENGACIQQGMDGKPKWQEEE